MEDLIRVATPAEERGFNGVRSGHFGRAKGFTLVDVLEGDIFSEQWVENAAHEHGGCGATVGLLVQAGVTHAVVVGIGGGPLAALREAGIKVYVDDRHQSAYDAVAALLGGELRELETREACSGH